MVSNMVNKEQLSALVDGEAVDLSVIKQLETDPQQQQTWRDYHLISDVMKGDAPSQANWDIAAKVAMALESEPSHSKLSSTLYNVEPILESQPTPQKARAKMPAWLSQLGQVGIAACVSLMVIFGVQQYGSDGDSNLNGVEDSQLPVLQTIPFAGSAEPVSLTRESVRPQSDEAQKMEQRRRINALMQDYELQLRLNHGE